MARLFLVPFRLLLRLAGSRWTYSTPPPHGFKPLELSHVIYPYGLDGPISISDSARYFCCPQRPDRLCGPPSVLSTGYRGHFPRWTKRHSRVADHSISFGAEVKKTGAIPPLPYTSSWYSAELIKHRGQFNILLPVPFVEEPILRN
jgi:hypothetical protein